MCGLTGFWHLSVGVSANAMQSIVQNMASTLSHRGPDCDGTWADTSVGLALGHRRLAIVDLSAAGQQPMVSATSRYVIAFNGEIYNHLALRSELQGTVWRGHSDTETLLAAIEAWGIEATLRRCEGMFAFALWDTVNRKLILVRDRFGEKPLYYGWAGGAFLFGSELKALRAYPGFNAPVCRNALVQYLRYMYVPAPLSIYEGIFKLEPGCLLTVQNDAPSKRPCTPIRPGERYGSVTMQRWWSLADVVTASQRNPMDNEAQALALLEKQLQESVRSQSLADVPLGAFLSGGVDSSMIVALMQRQALDQGSQPVKTFTISFDEKGFDEAPYARAVAQHLGTDHHEMRVTAQMAMDVINELPKIYDEPFADSSQIPTHLISRAARQQVTVALSGDAGDELFGGYNRYLWGPRIWNRLARLPYPMRRTLGRLIQTIPVAGWNAMSTTLGVSQLGDKAYKLSARLDTVRGMDDLYWSLVSEWTGPESLVKGVGENALSPQDLNFADDGVDSRSISDLMPQGLDPVERMMFLDSMTYLPDDILCKVDRAAMACGLETRVPFLDHRLVELAWRLPMHMKIRNNQGKWALRQVLYKYVPRELIERPKAGFAIPIGHWLRGPLLNWAESLLSEQRLNEEGFFHAKPIRKAWVEHLSGKRDWTGRIWAVLMFQAWLEREKV
jgi:asparagine synthase (glutamine-hydrolysing)